MSTALDISWLESQLRGRALGWPLLYHPRVPSTQDVVRRAALEGAPEGLLALADEQTAGRGRQGRSWWAPFGTAILSSLLLRPFLPPQRLGQVGMVAGLAMGDALERVAGVATALKWPNDILLANRKLGGILVETLWEGERLQALILGLGLNVTVSFPPDSPLHGQAISLREAGYRVRREPLLVAYLDALEGYYARLQAGWSPLDAWAGRLSTLGQRVSVHDGVETWEGLAEGVSEEGALLVRRGEELVTVRAALVTRLDPLVTRGETKTGSFT